MRALVLLLALSAHAQVTVSVGNSGMMLKLTTSSGLGSTGSSRIGSSVSKAAASDVIHRVLRDAGGNPIFGYDIEVREAGGGRYRIAVLALSEEYERTLESPRKVPTFEGRRDAAVLGEGDKAVIDLLENPSTGEHITDTMELIVRPSGGGVATGGAMAGRVWAKPHSDPDDMQLSGFTVIRNGQPLGAMTQGLGISGSALMFYVPGEGGYFFSRTASTLVPFMKSGRIEGARLTFTWNADRYEIVSARPILGAAGAMDIWVYHDPNYRPPRIRLGNATDGDTVQAGACADVKCWFPKNE